MFGKVTSQVKEDDNLAQQAIKSLHQKAKELLQNEDTYNNILDSSKLGK